MRSLIMTIGIGLAACPASASTRYASTTGSGDCSSWADACGLSSALGSAVSGDEVWVKAGAYSGSFSLPNGVRVIGGFAGTETSASQSDPSQNVSVLDGGGMARAVEVTNASGSTVLRGFTIQNGSDDSYDGGGAVLIKDSGALFVRCRFQTNSAGYFGGAVAIHGNSSPQFVNCVFKNNGTGSGTGVSPLGGGAVFVYSGSPTFTNCLFHDNKAGEGGAILTVSGTPTFRNCTVANNQATIGLGGGIFDQDGAISLHNSVVWGNTAVRAGDQIYNGTGVSTTVTYSNVQGGWSGAGNIDSDPLFLNAAGGNFDIPVESPCKDVGNNADIPLDVGDLDWDGNTSETVPRDLNMDGRKVQGQVDIGAYEAPLAGGT